MAGEDRYAKHHEAEGFILDRMKDELVGPVSEDEVLEGVKPLEAYACGILWPDSVRKRDAYADDGDSRGEEEDPAAPSDDDGEGNEGDYPEEIEVEDFTKDIISGALVEKPSTMGITVMLEPDVDEVAATLSFGTYAHEAGTRKADDGTERRHHVYRRTGHSLALLFDLSRDAAAYAPLDGGELGALGVSVLATRRSGLPGERRLFTFTVTNVRESSRADSALNENSLYQCRLELDAGTGRFAPLATGGPARSDVEDGIMDMQYMDVLCFAQGHGCAADWEEAGGFCRRVWSDFMPTREVCQMKPREDGDDIFSVRYLYTAERGEVVEGLRRFLGSYDAWRLGQERLSGTDAYSGSREAAGECLGNIAACEGRIGDGIKVLSGDDAAWKAFTLANEAMYRQRVSMALMRKRIRSEDEFEERCGEPRWYPFQLFYLVMMIPDIVDGESRYRDTVDLLWFPTGGGKTEAYMAVTAFTVFYDRIAAPDRRHGTTVLMRYTLRLLTIQQFERATALICACDMVRRDEGLGGESISIGLWIGGGATPNRIDEAVSALDRLTEDREAKVEPNPVQIRSCPFCGRELNALDYDVGDGKHMRIRCRGCGETLPVHIVDTDIYEAAPTLVISTVDKFATIAWKEETGRLFGRCGVGARAPRLIIQDELHLISGSLGTLTGMYESAVDRLCRDGSGGKPKIIASTATVRNAARQIKALYDRDCFQFPPGGLSRSDSFFALEATGDERPSRLYVGLSDQGGSIMGLMVRVYAVLIVSAYYLSMMPDMPADVVDEYYTIIGYFNSLKELGTVSSVLRERIRSNVRLLLNGKFAGWSERLGVRKGESGKYLFETALRTDELTSRKNATEIVDTLADLQVPYTGDPADERPFNYVLCSNMFSVGVDVSRLGLMAVYGQPKGNSDYIQATSRVGRNAPGLIFCMYSAVRTRDRSYYEQFNRYHGCFYRYVEPASVTPFSSRSVEKGLHSVFVALVRHLVPGMGPNDAARLFDPSDAGVREIRDYLLARIASICGQRSADEAGRYLDGFIRHWQRNTSVKLVYDADAGQRNGGATPLLVPADRDDGEYPVLRSLRNVEHECGVYIRSGERG